MLFLFLFLACDGDEGALPVRCPECAPCPPPASGLDLDAWESEMLAPAAEELKAGVRLHGEDGFGICRGKTRCEAFVGVEPGELRAGDYLVRAELDVPPLGEGWKARFETHCTVTTPAGRELQRDHEREYEINHTGGSRGYRLEPMWRIASPSSDGARTCTFALTPVRPDGKEQDALTGAYATPAPPPAP